MTAQPNAPDGISSGARKVNFNVSEQAYTELSLLAKETQRSMTEIIRLGIALAKIALLAQRQRQRLVIADEHGTPVKELVLPT